MQWVLGTLSWAVKLQWYDAPPTSVEVKKAWIYTSTPPYAFMVQCLVKLRANVTFFFFPISCRSQEFLWVQQELLASYIVSFLHASG
jgi:hypothetical protein